MAKVKQKRQVRNKGSESINGLDITKGTILYDNVLVRPIMVEETGVVARPQQYEDKSEWGEVLAVGEGRIFDNGTIVPMKVKKGDRVLFQKYSAQKFRHQSKDFLIIKEEDIYYISRP